MSSQPSLTTTIEKSLPRAWRCRISSHASSTVSGSSGIRITSAPPAIPLTTAIQPVWRPITSRTMTRLCDSAVVCSRSIASVAIETAVSSRTCSPSPRGRCRSSSGRRPPHTPCSAWRRDATPRVSSPPTATSASIPSRSMFSSTRSTPPSTRYGFVRDVPMIVPPRGRMPETSRGPSSSASPSISPRQPSRTPTTRSPGQAPPGDGTDDRVQARAVAPAGQHADCAVIAVLTSRLARRPIHET